MDTLDILRTLETLKVQIKNQSHYIYSIHWKYVNDDDVGKTCEILQGCFITEQKAEMYIKKLYSIHNTGKDITNHFQIVKIIPPKDWNGKENPNYPHKFSEYKAETVWIHKESEDSSE